MPHVDFHLKKFISNVWISFVLSQMQKISRYNSKESEQKRNFSLWTGIRWISSECAKERCAEWDWQNSDKSFELSGIQLDSSRIGRRHCLMRHHFHMRTIIASDENHFSLSLSRRRLQIGSLLDVKRVNKSLLSAETVQNGRRRLTFVHNHHHHWYALVLPLCPYTTLCDSPTADERKN